MDDLVDSLNSNEQAELKCELLKLDWTSDDAKCGPDFDRIICWPPSQAGKLAIMRCMDELNGVKYDTSRKCCFYSDIKLCEFSLH